MKSIAFTCAAALAGCAATHAPPAVPVAAPTAPPASAPDPDPTLGPSLDRFVAQRFADGTLLGLAVMVVKDGRVVLAHGYGFTDLDRKTPVTIDTELAIGSLSKQLTAAAVMQLVAAHKIRLDDPIATYLPQVTAPVTIRQLLHHQSGLPDHATGLNIGKSDDELLAAIAAMKPTFTPGSKFEYSNTNYYLLGRVVEAVSGERFADYLRAHVFAAAGMTATRVCTWPSADGAQASTPGPDGALIASPRWDLSIYGGAGAICSTARDLVRWQQALFGGTIVDADGLAFMTTPATTSDGGKTEYGGGLMIGSFPHHRVINHAGAIPGAYESELSIYPDDHVVVVLLTNTFRSPPMTTLPPFDAMLAFSAASPVPKDLPVDAALRAAVVGTYDDGRGPRAVTLVGDELHLQTPAGIEGRLLYQGDDTFVFATTRAITLRFDLDPATGRATRVNLRFDGDDAGALPRVGAP